MKTMRLKHIAQILAGQSPSSESIVEDGAIPFLQGCAEFGDQHPEPKHYCDNCSKHAPVGSWLMSVRAPVGQINFADKLYGIGRGLAAIVPTVCNYRFLGYLLHHVRSDLDQVATGSTYQAVSASQIGNLKVQVPDLNAQKTVADYLDRETARVDQLIEKKQRLAAALNSKISDFADLVVTGRDDPDRILKEVSSPWLSSIPVNWELKRAKYLFSEMSRPVLPIDEVITAFRDGQVCLRNRRRAEGYTFAELEVGYQHINKGDLVIHTMDAFAGAIGVSEDDGKATGEYAVCTPLSEDVNCTYYAHVLRCMARRNYIFVLCPSVRERAPRFRFVRFAPVFLPFPPREEQDQIVNRISEATRNLRNVQQKALVSIERLREYRAALITAAVTGQIDVSSKAVKVQAKPDRATLRVLLGAEIVHRHRSNRKFGRVKFQKELYLAEAYAGISELEGSYLRKAAGPHDQQLMDDVESGMTAQGYYRADQPDGNGSPVTYVPMDKAGQHESALQSVLGSRADKLSAMIDLLRDFDTNAVEAIATLYAVWNDLLARGETPDDDTIIHHALTEWHPEKSEKFTVDDLAHWLGWMKRHDFVPTGSGPVTTTGRLFP